MKKLLLLIVSFLTFFSVNAQTITASIVSGTFVEGIIGVGNTISVETEAPGTNYVTFYVTEPTGTLAYDSYTDYDGSDGYNWDIDMGYMVPDAIIWAVFYDVSDNYLDDSYNSALIYTIIPMPHWLIDGSVSNVSVDINTSTISFDGLYPIYEYSTLIDNSVKGIGGKPLDIIGSFTFTSWYDYTSPTPVVDYSSAQLDINLLDQTNLTKNIEFTTICELDQNFNLTIEADDSITTEKIELKTPKIKFPIMTGVSVSVDAGISLYGTLKGQIIIGQDVNSNEYGFIENSNGEKTKIVGILTGDAFVRGKISVLGGVASATGSINGKARLGIGYDFSSIPSVNASTLYGADIDLSGRICYETFWGLGPNGCKESDSWYYGSDGLTSIFNKSGNNLENLFNTQSFNFRDTGTLVLPDFKPQPSMGTRGDTLYTVWMENIENEGYLLFSKLDNSINEFTDVKIVVNNSNSISNPKVAILPSGSAIITWSQNRYNEVTLPVGSDEFDQMQAQDVWFAIYDNGLDSIVYTQKLDDNEASFQSGRAEGEAMVSVGDNNDAMITWVVTDANAANSDIYYTHLTESTTSWDITAPAILSDLTGLNSNVGVVYTDNSSVLTVWVNDPDNDEDTYNSNLFYSVWDGTSWSNAQALGTNDGTVKLNELSIAANNGYVAFGWTSSIFDLNNEFENRMDLLVYDAVNQSWDLGSSFSDTDSNYYFQLPVASISSTGKATICYQVIDMYADTNYISNGELYLFVKDLNVGGTWQEITENAYLCDTNTFVWDLTAGFAENDNYYVITQEYNDNGVVTAPINGVKFGDPDLSLVLRGLQINSDNSVDDIEEPGNIASGVKELNMRSDFRFLNAYPNPFSDVTVIEYQLENNANVQMEVFDFLGNKVAELVNSNLSPGIYKTIFVAGDLSGGVYFNKLTVNGKSITKKLVLVK
jgi:hypothetical protein